MLDPQGLYSAEVWTTTSGRTPKPTTRAAPAKHRRLGTAGLLCCAWPPGSRTPNRSGPTPWPTPPTPFDPPFTWKVGSTPEWRPRPVGGRLGPIAALSSNPSPADDARNPYMTTGGNRPGCVTQRNPPLTGGGRVPNRFATC